ncbi:radial spoke head protein 6 homolog A-like [Gouania willdenowi]|uniref:radial spoke head protein 6 homolog A-like n=1 Tax=Gouania willdenowi TaxID=441366 RepID=UPI001055E681|nr:radial spoke head protein 6 homolog A-like [Gouania willdenowi]
MEKMAAKVKAFMQKSSSESQLNLYDHLVEVLMKVIDEEPHNAVDIIEDVSHRVKQYSLKDWQSTLKDLSQPTSAELLADQQRLLFVRPDDAEQEEELVETALPNVSELAFFLEQAGVGLGKEEMHRIFLALKQLVDSEELQRCRLWGKILGTTSSYIVAEAECKEGLEDEEEEEKEEEEQSDEGAVKKEEDPLLQTNLKPPPVVPKEALGTGANKFMFYVCSEPGLPWVKLPSVSPAQITAARQIHKFFTGRLDAPVVCNPPFPGKEVNYLRAQISRISAGTQASPLGYYEMQEEEEESDAEDSYEVNPDFEGIPVAEMTESLTNWVHNIQHILPQGRCTWVNLAAKAGDDSNENEEEEEEEDEPEPEIGPPLLTPLSKDEQMFNIPPWNTRLSSRLTPQHAVAVLRSNLWPGAVAYADGKKFDNIYVGWGVKYMGEGYSPALPPLPQGEFPTGPEISEAVDPAVEEEESQEEHEGSQEEREESDEEEKEDDDDE